MFYVVPPLAALVAQVVEATTRLSQFDLCFIIISIAGGVSVLSHINDCDFRLVGRFLQMDEKTTLKTWTLMETLLGTIAYLLAVLGSLVL